MTDLAAWLLEQIAEDDAKVRGASRPSILTLPRRWHNGRAWLPMRIRDENAAKRKVIQHCTDAIMGWREDSCTPADDAACAISDLDHVLRLLAVPYSDRPGYRTEWRPDGD